MDQQSISRINELARLAKTRALTSEESAERERLRKAYIAAFREQTRRTLDETRVKYERTAPTRACANIWTRKRTGRGQNPDLPAFCAAYALMGIAPHHA